jgi:hypothetical protein
MSWTPGPDVEGWFLDHDPEQSYGAMQADYQLKFLAQARPDAFGALERQLSATALLAEQTAHGLRGLQGNDVWQGEAGDQYRDTLNKLPPILDAAHKAYSEALSAIATFSETTFALQRKYHTYKSDLATWRKQWYAAIGTTWPDKATGLAHINRLKSEASMLTSQRDGITGDNDDAYQTLQGALSGPTAAAPRLPKPGELDQLLGVAKNVLHTFIGIWSDGKAFVEHPTMKGFEQVTADVAADASVLALLAAAPEALAGVGALDAAGGGLLTGAEVTGNVAKGIDLAATTGNVSAHYYDKEYGTGTLEALLVLAPGIKEAAGGTELRQTLGESNLLVRYKQALSDDGNPEAALQSLDPQERDALKAMVPHYADRGAVDGAIAKMRTKLQEVRKAAGLVEAPKGFVWENGVLVPVSDHAGAAIDSHNGDHHGD